jgi:hypothetical protein
VKISLAREALLGQLQTVSRVASTRSAIQAFARLSLIRAVCERVNGHRHERSPSALCSSVSAAPCAVLRRWDHRRMVPREQFGEGPV